MTTPRQLVTLGLQDAREEQLGCVAKVLESEVAVPWFKTGALGWVIVGGVVLVWDLTASETMSDAFRRAQGKPITGVAVAVAWVVLTAHLYERLPKKLDPLHAIRIARDWKRDRALEAPC